MRSAKTDQTAQVYRLVWVFTGNTILNVGFFYALAPVNVIGTNKKRLHEAFLMSTQNMYSWRNNKNIYLGLVVQSVVSLTSSLRVISLTVLADSIHNILIFFAEKMHCKSYSHFFSKKFQHISISFNVNFNESLTNDIVSFEQLDPDTFSYL